MINQYEQLEIIFLNCLRKPFIWISVLFSVNICKNVIGEKINIYFLDGINQLKIFLNSKNMSE